MKKYILLVVIGIILLAVDIRIPVGEAYPKPELTKELGEQLQGKIISHFIGIRPKADILSDLLGFILILVGSVFLVKASRRFLLAIPFIPIAAYMYIRISILPYQLTLRELYLKTAGYHFLLVLLEILIEFIVIHGIVSMISCVQNQWTKNELLGGWILAMISKFILKGIDFFYGQGIFYHMYLLVMIGATVFYLYKLYDALKFKLEEHP